MQFRKSDHQETRAKDTHVAVRAGARAVAAVVGAVLAVVAVALARHADATGQTALGITSLLLVALGVFAAATGVGGTLLVIDIERNNRRFRMMAGHGSSD